MTDPYEYRNETGKTITVTLGPTDLEIESGESHRFPFFDADIHRSMLDAGMKAYDPRSDKPKRARRETKDADLSGLKTVRGLIPRLEDLSQHPEVQ